MPHEDPMRALEPFLGAWTVQADFPGARPEDTRGRATFEWLLGGRFLCQRSEKVPLGPIGVRELEIGRGILEHNRPLQDFLHLPHAE